MEEKIKISVPSDVERIIRTLEAAGYEAYAVGGCVRDALLLRTPHDWDITTSARPERVKDLFPHTLDTGLKHGTVTVMLGHEGYEVTTYRVDGAYLDGRHPEEVSFTTLLSEDLRRRDFTINAMAYHPDRGLVDLFDGQGDLNKHIVRCVGDAKERFGEDALRMMRAVRFSAQLDYEIEEKTKEAIAQLAGTLEKISAERIQAELVKLLLSAHPERIRTCWETGMTAVFFPEFDRMMETGQNNPHHCYSVGEHTIHSMMEVRADRVLRLSMLLHDSGKPATKTTDEAGIDHFHGHVQESVRIAKKLLGRLKFDNDTTDRVVRLVGAHDVWIVPDAKHMRRAMNRLGEDLFPELFEVKEADMRAQSMYERAEKENALAQLRRIYGEVRAAGECVSLKDLAVNGSDLIAAGMKPGKELGAVLRALLEEVLEDPSCNEKEILLQKAKALKA